MAPFASLLTASILVVSAGAFSPTTSSTSHSSIRPTTTTTTTTTRLNENFGFAFAEDQVENTPQLILGEANYKKWLNSVDPNNMLNRQVGGGRVVAVVPVGRTFVSPLRAVSSAAGNKIPATRATTHLDDMTKNGGDRGGGGVGVGVWKQQRKKNLPRRARGTDRRPYQTKCYPVLSRVRELGLLEKTAELGVLSKLEKQGLTLDKAEKLLPLLEDLGVLGLVANNQQLLINGVAPLAVEGAPLLLPLIAGALGVGAPAFYLAAAGAAGLDAFLFASGAEVPFLGLSAGAVAGLLLVPLSVVLAVVGGAVGNLKN
ncbi:hypothetical protein ACHAW5_002272 [Stephanodiscus triporus]|uniref:Ribosomal protein L4 n=1 Tax=Stephanodiscus triporus TaxID=2934178 RepID=A0ABD3N5V3_9STRA